MKTIMVVEDCVDMGDLYKSALEMENYSVVLVVDGTSAILELKNRPLPDLILLDLTIPGICGLQLLKLIREEPKWADTKVVFVSGVDNLSVSANEAGADGYFAKPFGLDKLYMEVAKYLH